MDRKNITGKNIKRIRIQKGMTVAQLSSALSQSSPLSSEEIVQMEEGTRKVYDHELLGISWVLRVPLSKLFNTPPKNRRPRPGPK